MWIVALIIALVFVAILVGLRGIAKKEESKDDAKFEYVVLEKNPQLGESYLCNIKVTNTGKTIWKPDEVRLGIVGDICPFAPARVDLSMSVEPGGSAIFTYSIKFDRTGPYTFQWQMVREGVRWFGEVMEYKVEVRESDIKPIKIDKMVIWANIICEMNEGYPILKMAKKLKALGINVWRLASFFILWTEMPYLKVNGKYDLSQWNPAYWKRFRYVIRTLLEAGIMPWLDWVEFCCIRKNELWAKHPWNKANGGFAERKSDILSEAGQKHIKRFVLKGLEEIQSLAPGKDILNWMTQGTDNEVGRMATFYARNWVFFMSRILQDAGVKVENIATSARENHSKIALVREADDPYKFLFGKYPKAVGIMGFHGWPEPEAIDKTLRWMYQVHRWDKGIKFVIGTDGADSGTDPRCDRYHKGWRPGPKDIKEVVGGLLAKKMIWIAKLSENPGVTGAIAADIIDHIIGAEILDWLTRKDDFDNPLIAELARALEEAVVG